MLKGKTRIELTDVTTKEKKIIEHNNMITNAVADLCKSDGLTIAPINYSGILGSNKLLFELFGGIFLWEDALDTSALNYYLPGGNKCVGYGSKSVTKQSSINKHHGIFNGNESGLQDDGSMKLVWDFATSQANGKISAISLTTKSAGMMGLGFGNGQFDDSIAYGKDEAYNSFGELINSNTKYIASGAHMPYGKDYFNYADLLYIRAGSKLFNPLYIEGDIIYGLDPENLFLYNNSTPSKHLSNNGKKLILNKFRMPRKHIFAGQNINQIKYIGSEEIQLPSEFNVSYFSGTSNSVPGYAMYSDGFIFILSGYEKNAQVTKINIVTKDVQEFNINLGGNITQTWNFNSFWQNNSTSIIMTPDKLILLYGNISPNNNHAIYYDLVDGVSEYHYIYQADSEDHSTATSYPTARCGDYIYLTLNNRYLGVQSMIDTKLDSQQRLNVHRLMITEPNSSISHAGFTGGLEYAVSLNDINIPSTFVPVKEGGQYKYIWWSNNYDSTRGGYLYPVTSPHLLLTKNNLDEPVTKTSAQTMKVIYTLKEV